MEVCLFGRQFKRPREDRAAIPRKSGDLDFFDQSKSRRRRFDLTAADYVFIFDPWWNEAVENQAIDRAHRFGREQKVIARRYVTSSSIEEKMMRLKERKFSFARGFFDFDAELEDITLQDLYALIST